MLPNSGERRFSISTASTTSIAAAIPSNQKWFAVTTTTSVVSAGYSTASHRQRERAAVMIAIATISAQPTCTDGIAEYWSAASTP